jgi:hypothetical protein
MSLSAPLFDEVRPVFFRVLSGASAPLFIDILHHFERALADRPEGIDREDAIASAEDVIESHPSLPVQEDDVTESTLNLRDRARLAIDRLIAAGWLEEQETTAWRRVLTLEGNGALMLKTLRQMAWPEAAVFSDKLSSVCRTLADPAMMEEQPWTAVETAISQAEEGLAELRGMGRSIQRHTRRQLGADSLKENLSEVFDRFAERIGRACYAELVRARLHTRLGTARQQLDSLPLEERLMEKMRAEVLRRDPALSPESAMGRVMDRLDQLGSLLGGVVPLVDRVDQRTAEFARRSLARFRYLQESGSERRAKVQAFFEALNRRFAGMRVVDAGDFDGFPLPALKLQDVRFFAGFDSLARPRRAMTPAAVESVPNETDESARSAGLSEFAQHWRSSLTVVRANRFVASLPGPSGTRYSVSELPLDDEEGMADLIACILHRRARTAAYRLEVDRLDDNADEPQWQSIGSHEIESLTLVKK